MNYLFNTWERECFWSPSDIGWIVGHSFSLYATNMAGAHSIIYEGKPTGTPNAGEFWRLMAKYKAKGMYIAPTAVRAIKKEDFEGDFMKE